MQMNVNGWLLLHKWLAFNKQCKHALQPARAGHRPLLLLLLGCLPPLTGHLFSLE